MVEYIDKVQLLERLKNTKGFNVEAFVTGPKGLDELEIEQIERETSVIIDEEAGTALTSRHSVRVSVWYTPQWHMEEQMRSRKGAIISPKSRYFSNSGTARKGETTTTTVIRELFGDAHTPGEMPQLKALLEANGITLGPEHLDFHSLAHYPTTDVHPSSVYLGFVSHVRVTNVIIDLAMLGLPERPWPNGTVLYDMGTYIPQSWRELTLEEQLSCMSRVSNYHYHYPPVIAARAVAIAAS